MGRWLPHQTSSRSDRFPKLQVAGGARLHEKHRLRGNLERYRERTADLAIDLHHTGRVAGGLARGDRNPARGHDRDIAEAGQKAEHQRAQIAQRGDPSRLAEKHDMEPPLVEPRLGGDHESPGVKPSPDDDYRGRPVSPTVGLDDELARAMAV